MVLHVITSISVNMPMLWSIILAEGRLKPNQLGTPGPVETEILAGLGISVGPLLLNVIGAILILVIGWIVAIIAASVTRGLLNRTNLDNRLAAWVTGRHDAESAPPIEKWASSFVFWLIMILVLVAFLEKLQLTVVSQPLNNFVNQILSFLPKLGGAAILLGVAWVLATVVKLVVTRALQAFGLDERLNQQTGERSQPEQLALSQTLANTLYWFIFLLFLPSILSTLELQGTLQPVQALLNEILAILPNILAAVVIGFAGWLVAQIVRRIVTNLLAATGTDQIGRRFGLSQTTGGQSLSWIIGTIVYVLILIPTAIAALNALKIQAISAPATAMLQQILTTIPQILTAGLILAFAYFLGKFISDVVRSILTGLGFNNIFYWLGLQAQPYVYIVPTPPPPVDSYVEASVPPASEHALVHRTPTVTNRTPSEIAGIVVLVGIMLFATVAATNVLQIPALTALVSGITVGLGHVLAGIVVFAVGLYLANLAFNLITSTGTRQARILGQTARISIIILVSAMALQQMGIASDIVKLAFGLLMGAIAVAIALAFGLGSRDIAAAQIREWVASFKEEKPPH